MKKQYAEISLKMMDSSAINKKINNQLIKVIGQSSSKLPKIHEHKPKRVEKNKKQKQYLQFEDIIKKQLEKSLDFTKKKSSKDDKIIRKLYQKYEKQLSGKKLDAEYIKKISKDFYEQNQRKKQEQKIQQRARQSTTKQIRATNVKQQLKDEEQKKKLKEMIIICDILKYFFGEHEKSLNTQYCNDYKTCEKWQLQQIQQNIQDTNLGDYIIKMTNPDNLDDATKKLYQIEQQNPIYPEVDVFQALEHYRQLFELQSNKKLQTDRQQIAYLIAFYFLKYKKSKEDHEQITIFLKLYEYYKLIENMGLSIYNKKSKQPIVMQLQKIARSQYPEQFELFVCLNNDKTPTKQQQKQWKFFRKSILHSLSQTLIQLFKEQLKYDEEHQKEREQNQTKSLKNKSKSSKSIKSNSNQSSKANKRFQILISNIPNLTQFFITFPQFFYQVVQLFYDIQNGDKQRKICKRQLFKGQCLKKTLIDQNYIWINTKNRPNDLTTLLRNCIMYKLTIKNHLHTRTFITDDEKHIMIVVKSNEVMLQNYAQKLNIKLEVDLGATDLFSFQPVDQYYRPLRLHSYINNENFKKKYNITGKKKQQNQKDGESIQNDMIKIYKSAQTMNDDELRSSIIQDQVKANESYTWLHKQFNIQFINQKALVNEYNDAAPDKQVWELYFVYNKLIIQFINRVRKMYMVDKKNREYYSELNANIGMLLRLMFIKAICLCNQAYLKHRQNRTIIPKVITDILVQKQKLKNIWFYLQTDNPSGFRSYSRSKKNQRVWRKFQINELKDRSKFFPAERLLITNKIINHSINIGKSLQNKKILCYFPLHDPYFLQNILIDPYLINIRRMQGSKLKIQNQQIGKRTVNNFYEQYQCKLTKHDFTNNCLQKRLEFSCRNLLSFDCIGIRYYCGEKIAFFFQFIKYLAVKAFPFVIFAFIIQILLWVQQTSILAIGTSSLTEVNNIIIFIFTFFNVIWTTNLVQKWKYSQKIIAYNYGVAQLVQQEEKRVNFQGSFKRNMQTDELNYQYEPKWKTFLKLLFTIILNLTFVVLVVLVLVIIFLFKAYLFEGGFNQSIVNLLPSILISIVSKIFSYLYTILLNQITIFQNHKTISQYQGSLVSKASLITFIITFAPIFVLAFFSSALSSSFICQIRTTQTNVLMNSCDYFVSTQLQSMIFLDCFMAIASALFPFLLFHGKQLLCKKQIEKDNKFNFNFFQPIDSFYEEQDQMDSYMHNEQLDKSWQGYMGVIIIFTATTLFAPAYPLSFAFLFITGILKLHTLKREIIYYKRRIQPIKANSINWWLIIIQVISYVSIITNVSYMIYTRKVFKQDQSKLFFFFIVALFALKFYMVSQYQEEDNKISKRSQLKINNFFLGRKREKYSNTPEQINTDIENVFYDETILKRKFHNIKQANLQFKNKKNRQNKDTNIELKQKNE